MTQPAYASAGPPPARRKPAPWTWIAAVLAVVLAGGALAYYLVSRDAEPTVTTSGGQLNKPTKDGRFVFTVTGVRCGVDKVGDDVSKVEPEGSFCLVDIAVRNGATTAANFDSSAQRAYDGDGDEFPTDMQAAVLANNGGQAFLDSIYPGGQVTGTLVFDVPEGTTPAAVVLRESLATPGARIALR